MPHAPTRPSGHHAHAAVRRLRAERARHKGAAVIEFALVLPVLLMILLGIIDFGLAIYTQSVITHASREGARAGVVLALNRPSASTIQTVVQNELIRSLGSLNQFGVLSFTPPAPCVDTGNNLTVQIAYSFQGFALGVLGKTFNHPIHLSAKTTMACE